MQIDINYQVIVNNIRRGNVEMEYISSKEVAADSRSKQLLYDKFHYITHLIRIY